MTPSIDVLAVDLDGTLLGPDGRVSPRNQEAITEARNAGVDVLVATGRAFIESKAILESVGQHGMFIGAGGAVLQQALTGRTVERRIMPHEVVKEVSRSLVNHDHKALVLKDAHATGYDYLAVGPAVMAPSTEWWFSHLPVRIRFVDRIEEDPDPEHTLRIGTVAPQSALLGIAMELREDLGDRALLQHWAAVAIEKSDEDPIHMLEVFNPRVSKWSMLQAYVNRLGYEQSRVAAIGDGLNDVSMIEAAPLGIAMANADDAVLAVADRVTASNGDDGVAQAIECILAGQW